MKRKTITKDQVLEFTEGLTGEYLLNEAADRAKYFLMNIDGSCWMPKDDPQVEQILKLLLAATLKLDLNKQGDT